MPIYITYFVIHFIVNLLDGTLALLPKDYHPEQLIGHAFPGMGVRLHSRSSLFLTGMLVTNFIGHRLLAIWEKLAVSYPIDPQHPFRHQTSRQCRGTA